MQLISFSLSHYIRGAGQINAVEGSMSAETNTGPFPTPMIQVSALGLPVHQAVNAISVKDLIPYVN